LRNINEEQQRRRSRYDRLHIWRQCYFFPGLMQLYSCV